ncbi:Bifunctional (P)ppGpp synthetase/guanosine-3',5'-bis(Diphosphate) 3'-pyrophosphohydrolase OS=Streptomyces microflavus OX=1919 GN=G3I39_38175 PE=3 SV=1 [Streptomyces microflavus]
MISEIKDFIAAPKFNLYQSLHTAVVGPEGAVAEVLIRTHRMHKVADAGVVALGNPYAHDATTAHDGAAQQTEPSDERADPTRPGWLSRLLDWQESATDPDTFWTTLRADLAQDREITVFRTDGGTLGLPAGASCIDAAYAQYGEPAHAGSGARVNGRLATLSTLLSDGDTVPPLLALAPLRPARRWLDHARTPAARIAITGWLCAHPDGPGPGGRGSRRPYGACGRQPAVRRTRPHPVRRARRQRRRGRPREPRPPGRLLYAGAPGRGGRHRGPGRRRHRAPPGVSRRRPDAGDRPRPRRRPLARRGRLERVRCLPGHARRRVVRAPRLLADLTEAIATADAAIVSATVEPPSEQRVRHTYTLQLPDAAGLPALMRAMREVAGVYDVSRARSTRRPPAEHRPGEAASFGWCGARHHRESARR